LAAYVGGLAASGGFLEFLKLGSAHYGVTPALTLPIFDGGRLRGNLQAQTGAYDEAVARYNQALLTALKQTATALTALRTLSEQRTALDSQHQIAKANTALAQQRFAAGLSNRLPLLQAERSVLQLQVERTELNASAIEQLTSLFAALGGTVLPDTLKTYTTIEFSPLSPSGRGLGSGGGLQ
jgi:outer membrane protein TolC